MTYLDEAQVEIAKVGYLRGLGYHYVHGPRIASDGQRPERSGYGQVIFLGRLRDALVRINPTLPHDALLPKLLSGEISIKDAEKFVGRNG